MLSMRLKDGGSVYRLYSVYVQCKCDSVVREVHVRTYRYCQLIWLSWNAKIHMPFCNKIKQRNRSSEQILRQIQDIHVTFYVLYKVRHTSSAEHGQFISSIDHWLVQVEFQCFQGDGNSRDRRDEAPLDYHDETRVAHHHHD